MLDTRIFNSTLIGQCKEEHQDGAKEMDGLWNGHGVGHFLYITYPATDGELGTHLKGRVGKGMEGVLSMKWCGIFRTEGRHF